MPPELKQNYFYARRNVILLRWAFGILIGVVGIIAVTIGGDIFLHRSVVAYTKLSNDDTSQLKSQDLENTQKQVDAISGNLKLVVMVLSREVLFSKLLQQIGGALPQGSVLTSLNIAQVVGGLDLQAAATNYQTASQIQVNLADPKAKIFSKADIVSIQCQSGSGSGISSIYPCKVQIRAQYASNNPFSFINNSQTSQKATP